MSPIINKDILLKAIIRLRKEGKIASIENIRKITGGSPNTIVAVRDELYNSFFEKAHDIAAMLTRITNLEDYVKSLVDLQEKSNQLIEALQQRVEECERNRRDIRAQALSMAEQGISAKDIATTLGVHINAVNLLLKKNMRKTKAA